MIFKRVEALCVLNYHSMFYHLSGFPKMSSENDRKGKVVSTESGFFKTENCKTGRQIYTRWFGKSVDRKTTLVLVKYGH